MKHLYVTKDLNSLVVTTSIYAPRAGFDLLNGNQYKEFEDDLIEIKKNNKLFHVLLHDIDAKFDIASAIFDSKKDRASFLGLSERNYYRIEDKFLKNEEIWIKKNKQNGRK